MFLKYNQCTNSFQEGEGTIPDLLHLHVQYSFCQKFSNLDTVVTSKISQVEENIAFLTFVTLFWAAFIMILGCSAFRKKRPMSMAHRRCCPVLQNVEWETGGRTDKKSKIL
jgi:hypothetical protein